MAGLGTGAAFCPRYDCFNVKPDSPGRTVEACVALQSKIGKTVLPSNLDPLFVGDGADNVLIAGDGEQILYGRAGNDILAGGSGSDTFLFGGSKAANGVDIITDFQRMTPLVDGDVLDLSQFAIPKGLNTRSIGQYVWVVDNALYVDPAGGRAQTQANLYAYFVAPSDAAIALGQFGNALWQSQPYLQAGDQLKIRTTGYDGFVVATTSSQPIAATMADSTDYRSGDPADFAEDGRDAVTNDLSLANLPAAGGTVLFRVDGGLWSDVAPQASGLADGAHTLEIRQIMPDGRFPAFVQAIAFTLDTKADPAHTLAVSFNDLGRPVPVNAVDATISVTGLAADVRGPDATGQNKVAVTVSNGVTTQNAVWNNSDQSWHYNPSLISGDLTATVTVMDKAGNTATATDSATRPMVFAMDGVASTYAQVYNFNPLTSVMSVFGQDRANPTGPYIDISSGPVAYGPFSRITGSGNVLIEPSNFGTASDLTDIARIISIADRDFPNTIGFSFFTNTLVVYSGTGPTANAGIYDIITMGSGGRVFEVELVAILYGVGANSLTSLNFA